MDFYTVCRFSECLSVSTSLSLSLDNLDNIPFPKRRRRRRGDSKCLRLWREICCPRGSCARSAKSKHALTLAESCQNHEIHKKIKIVQTRCLRRRHRIRSVCDFFRPRICATSRAVTEPCDSEGFRRQGASRGQKSRRAAETARTEIQAVRMDRSRNYGAHQTPYR